LENTIYLYKMISLGLAYPDKDGWEFLEEFLPEAGLIFEGDIPSALLDLKDYFREHKPALEEMQSEYLSVFDMGRKVTPYETEYVREKIGRKPRLLADIAGFYKAFGFEVNTDAKNREAIDHISVELEFMLLLYLKLVLAMDDRLQERVEIVKDAIRTFLKDHLAGWGLLYCSLVKESEAHEFYKKVCALLNMLLESELKKYGLDAGALQRGLFVPYRQNPGMEDFTCGPMPLQ